MATPPPPPPPPPGCEDPVTRPNIKHESDCQKFYHCGSDGSKVLKTCGPGTLFSVVHMICAWPDDVRKERPECGRGGGITPIFTYYPKKLKLKLKIKTNMCVLVHM